MAAKKWWFNTIWMMGASEADDCSADFPMQGSKWPGPRPRRVDLEGHYCTASTEILLFTPRPQHDTRWVLEKL